MSESSNPSESDAVRENRHALYRKVDAIEKLVGEMHVAVVGNDLGNIGLVKRQANVEAALQTKASKEDVEVIAKKVETHDRKLWLAVIFLGVLWTGFMTFKDKLLTLK